MLARLILFLVLALASAHPTQAAYESESDGWTNLPAWHWVAGGVFRSVSFSTASLGVAVGEGGLIVRTEDGGKTWEQVPSGIKTNLNHVYLIDQTYGWAVGDKGVILFTQNGGVGWERQTVPTTANINRVFFLDSNRGWAVGDNGVILYTTNRGLKWDPQTSGVTKSLYGVDFVDASYGWATGQDGIVLVTTSGGTSWTLQTSCTETHTLYDVDFVNRNSGWLVGMGGALWQTSDGGNQWTEWFIPDWTRDLYDIELIGSTSGWIVGTSGFLAQYQNSTWTKKESGTEVNLYGADFVNFSNGWLVGEAGSVFYTSDGGQHWKRLLGSTTGQIRDLYFVDDKRGWAGVGWSTSGFPGQIIATQDGGSTWNVQRSGITWVNEIQFVTQFEGWAVTGSSGGGEILHTFDGGLHWTSRLSGARPFRGIQFVGAAYGWAVGGAPNGNGWIYVTTNGGETWSEQKYLYGQHNLYDVCFSDTTHGWAVGEYGTIYATANGGGDWNPRNSGVTKTLTSVYCYGKWVWAVGSDVILFSSEWGNTWQVQRDGAGIEYYHAADFSGPAFGWVGGIDASKTETLVLASADVGNTWLPKDIPLNFGTVSAVHSANYGYGPVMWIGGGQGILLSNRYGDSIPTSILLSPAKEGDLFSSDGQAHLHFPAGLVGANTVITYTPTTPAQAPATGDLSAWRIFDLTAVEGGSQNPPTITPGTCYTITVNYKGWLVREDTQLGIYHWNGSQWKKEVSSQADWQLDRVTACVDHFSYFALLGKRFQLFLPIVLR
ncbi:MAG: YCF48-related protein [Anaerolineales bacterium]|nr:YCF48-related protein [Anaerolineales bacterium]MDW8447888.1 YCF48-related protein [Anaerolineales bacterium]